MKVTIVSKRQLMLRYTALANSTMANLTKEAQKLGYSIARIEQKGLNNSNCLAEDIQNAMERKFPETSIQIWAFTDLSELNRDTVYVAYRKLQRKNFAHFFEVISPSSHL